MEEDWDFNFSDIFERAKTLVKNNWKKMVFGGIAGGLAMPFLYRIAGFAAKRYLTYRTLRSHNMLRRMKKQQLFEMMDENFNSTFRNWFDLMKDNIKRNLNAEKFTDLLKNGYGNKYENWMELKMVAFTSVLSLVYGSAMLIVLLRLQVNAISGILYKQMDEVPPGLEVLGGSGDACTERRITEELQQDYMVLTRYLCTKGMDSLCSYMYEKAHSLVSRLSLKQKLSVSDIEQIFLAIRNQKLSEESKRFGVQEWSPITDAWRYMFSEETTKQYLYPMEAFKSSETVRESFLRTLICEAYDLVNAEDARTILKFLETHGINHYLDRISEFIATFPQNDSDTSQISEETGSTDAASESPFDQPTAPLAKLVPMMNTFVGVEHREDTWAAILLNNESLKSYSANIYESYSSKQFD